VAERLFGIETEYALTAFLRGGAPVAPGHALNRFMEVARQRLPHLPGRSATDMFLTNGARLYIDCGMHPEWSTAECATPDMLTRQVLAGEQVLARLADEFVATERQIADVVVSKSNVDYSGANTTWGCHESYLHKADPRQLPDQLIPHLVTRVVYTGAGGFLPPPRKPNFTLSPRVAHLTKTMSDSSTRNRGIFHTKNESLSGPGFHRLHVLCGESLCSETATWLKVGATALVVAMIEAGLQPARSIRLSSPLQAMQKVATDPTCTVIVANAKGKALTAIGVQRQYLELAQAHARASFMPPWATPVIKVWGAVLDRLEGGAPDSVATLLDWGIKLVLYRTYLEKRGSSWKQFPSRPELVEELFEADARFGQLGGRGVFRALESARVLDHHVSGVDRIDDAVENPPDVGRARVRGNCVKRLAGSRRRFMADWQGIWDIKGRTFLDLANPFEKTERWMRGGESVAASVGRWHAERLMAQRAPDDLPRTPDGFAIGDRVFLQRTPDSGDLAQPQFPNADAPAGTDLPAGETGVISRILRRSDSAGQSIVSVDVQGRPVLCRTNRLVAFPINVPF
jgi:proteasome accessory factor A